MRSAVWLYRFAPGVPFAAIKKAFGVSRRSLNFYVKASCQSTAEQYNLYFGAAGRGISGMADRALTRENGRVDSWIVFPAGYTVDLTAVDAPALAKAFLTKPTSTSRSSAKHQRKAPTQSTNT
jgi:hypothetical protein